MLMNTVTLAVHRLTECYEAMVAANPYDPVSKNIHTDWPFRLMKDCIFKICGAVTWLSMEDFLPVLLPLRRVPLYILHEEFLVFTCSTTSTEAMYLGKVF